VPLIKELRPEIENALVHRSDIEGVILSLIDMKDILLQNFSQLSLRFEEIEQVCVSNI
jgi:hypothetical protein